MTASYLTGGRIILKLEPRLALDLTVIEPPCNLIIFLAQYKPRPVPPTVMDRGLFILANFLNSLGISFLDIPTPWSATVTTGFLPCLLMVICVFLPSSEYLQALSIIFST